MRIQTIFNKTYITWLDEYNRCPNVQIQIYSVSGHGKGTFCEGLAESWQNVTGGICIWLVDPKKTIEGSFAMYEPIETYHLNRLKSDGMLPKVHDVKLYSPFSFNIPKGFLPPINFYTIPIKNLGKEEFGILAETDFDSETVKVMMRAKDNLTRDDGLFAFLHEIQRMVKGRREKKHQVPDPKNFWLSVGAGTSKSVVESSSYLSPFYNDYFLRKESCPYAINWKEILNDNSCYHVFFSKWVAPLNDKIHGFIALTLLEQILRNIDYAKKPVLIIIPEILFLCPEYSLGWSLFLGEAFEKAMITMRGKGRGVSSIADAQSWDKTSKKLSGSATVTFFGRLNPQDLERVCKARGYNKENRDRIMSLKQGQFIMTDAESDGIFRGFFAKHRHREESYDWIESYKQNFPDKMERYDNLVAYMKKELAEEENKIKKQIETRRRQERIEKAQEEKELEEKSTKGIKLTHEIKKAKGKQDEARDIIKKTMYEYLDNPNISDKEKTQRKLSEKFKVGRFVINKWLNEKDKPETELSEEEIEPMIGEGVMEEEVDENFDKILDE